MAGSLNKVILIGNLRRDSGISHTADGNEIASFIVATSETWKDRTTGENKEKNEWHRVVIFSKGLVSVVKNYAKKGTKVYLEGNLQTRKWVDSLVHEKYTTEIVLQNFNSQFILLISKGGGTQTPESDAPKNMVTNFDHSDVDDEISF